MPVYYIRSFRGCIMKLIVSLFSYWALLASKGSVLAFVYPINLHLPSQASAIIRSERSQLRSTTPTNYETLGDVDGTKLLSQSTFPIKPDSLIALAKEAIFEKRIGTADNGVCLADDFMFRAAFVEVNKEKYLQALESFDLSASFDIKQNFFGWTVDPTQPNRVWFIGRSQATHTGDFFGAKPTGNLLVFPPESLHLDFNQDGKIQEFGFYTIDRAQGNTGGLGGAFGYFYGVGKPLPFPEGKPYKMSLKRRFFEMIGPLLTKLSKKQK